MYVDIAIGAIFALYAFWGWRKGFMRGLLGFISTAASVIAAVFLAKPLSKVFNNWFDLSTKFNKMLKGIGGILNFLLCAVIIYFTVWLIFFLLSRTIGKIKNENKKIDTTDKIAGIFLGIAKCFISISLFFGTLYMLHNIPMIAKFTDWMLDKSSIGKTLYNISAKIVYPLIKNIEAAITSGFTP